MSKTERQLIILEERILFSRMEVLKEQVVKGQDREECFRHKEHSILLHHEEVN